MFFAEPLKYPPGTKLLIPWNKPVSFRATDFIRILDGSGGFTAVFDFGPKSAELTEADPEYVFTYDEAGTYTLRVLVKYGSGSGGGAGLQAYEKFSWPVQVGCNADEFQPDGTMEFEAAAHATFNLPCGQRHVILTLPKASNLGGSSYNPASGSQANVPSADAFKAGMLTLGRQFQLAFAYGFGRIAPPKATEESCVHVHMTLDSLVYGSSSSLKIDLAAIQRWLREAGPNMDKADALDTVRHSIDLLCSTTNLSKYSPVNLVGGTALVPGDRTTNYVDVFAWRQYAGAALNAQQTVADTTLNNWSIYQGNFDRNVPVVDWPTVWRWEVVQTILQCVKAMYQEFGGSLDPDNARVLFTVAPDTGACSLRVFDMEANFWVQVTAVPTGKDGHVELTDMVSDAAQVARPGGGFATVRVAGIANLNELLEGVPYVYDLHQVQGALDGTLFADVGTITELSQTEIAPYQQKSGLDVSRLTGPDGTTTVFAGNEQMVVGTVGLAPLEMPDGKDVWSSLRPHALLSVLNGAMTPIAGRSRM